MKLEFLLDLAERQAREVLLEQKHEQILPTFVMAQRDGGLVIAGVQFRNDIEKRLVREHIRAMMRSNDTVAYSFLTEGWAVAYELHEDPTVVRPSQHSRRFEVVTALATNGVETKCKQWRMVRDDKGEVSALEFDSEVEGVSSPFGELLTVGNA